MDPAISAALSAVILAVAGLIFALTALLRSYIQDREMARTQAHLRFIDDKVDKHINGSQ